MSNNYPCRLTYIEETQKPSCLNGIHKHRKALYKCQCGNIREYDVSHVKNGHTKSCGCITRERIVTHGLTNHPLYKVWEDIKSRCYRNKPGSKYEYYGAEGVTVCNEWLNDFKAFYNWCMANGWRKGLEIDKDIKGGKIYSPANCLIVTHEVNKKYRRNSRLYDYKGEQLALHEIAKLAGMGKAKLRGRLEILKMSVEEAVNPPHRFAKHLYNGEMRSIPEISNLTGIPYPTLAARINKQKLTLDQALTKYIYAKSIKIKNNAVKKSD